MTPDQINGLFEFIGALMILGHVRRLYLDKMVRGVSMFPTIFFTSWGLWNLFYYPHLDQWWSFYGGIAIVCSNAVWLALTWYYIRRERSFTHNALKATDNGRPSSPTGMGSEDGEADPGDTVPHGRHADH